MKPGSSSSSCEEKRRTLEDIANIIRNCKKCRLHEHRTNPVPGEGDPCAKLVFIGEAPGRNEDLQGRPFVGSAGKLLTKLLNDNGFSREEVFITNIVKCRPPNNRDPKEDEVLACFGYLVRQLEVIQPEIIVLLGRHSTKHVLRYFGIRAESIMSIRGRIYRARARWGEVIIVPTLHPAAALYNPKLKSLLERDFKEIAHLARKPGGFGGLDRFLGL